ncbi:UNVERIFIED_CONTAM: hypothetical protein GTU68_044101 [Idotea baltica]|nr:hypothetical protein [Idotea baltica]
MHGLGNDFVIIDAVSQTCPELTLAQRQFLADRQKGIGCDQILLVEKATRQGVDFKYRIFNADGGEVNQCGNGARCFAVFVTRKGLTDKTEIKVETASGIITLTLKDNGEMVTVIPFDSDQQAKEYVLKLTDQQAVTISALSMGNPHAVVIVDNVDEAKVAELGPLIEGHQRFPDRVNAGFMEIMSRKKIKLRVFERGAGETQACGTGACAAVVSGIQRGILANEVTVDLLGGELEIVWQGESMPVWMTGPATHVFDGEIAWLAMDNI